MRNFNETFRTNVEATYNKINGFCNIYYDRIHEPGSTDDDMNMFSFLTQIRRCLVSIIEHSECLDMNMKTVFGEFICLSEFIHQI